jgi:hypothetical protein
MTNRRAARQLPLGKTLRYRRLVYFRQPKESRLATVYYEMQMLRFCAGRVQANWGNDQLLDYVLLEGFLLHFRNLVEFLSGKHHRREDDMSTKLPEEWAGRVLTPQEADRIRRPAIALDEQWFDLVSKYLQHCTHLRSTTPQGWNVHEMLASLEPCLVAFEAAFPMET